MAIERLFAAIVKSTRDGLLEWLTLQPRFRTRRTRVQQICPEALISPPPTEASHGGSPPG